MVSRPNFTEYESFDSQPVKPKPIPETPRSTRVVLLSSDQTRNLHCQTDPAFRIAPRSQLRPPRIRPGRTLGAPRALSYHFHQILCSIPFPVFAHDTASSRRSALFPTGTQYALDQSRDRFSFASIKVGVHRLESRIQSNMQLKHSIR